MKTPKWLLVILIGAFILAVIIGMFSVMGKKSPAPSTVQQVPKENTVSPTVSKYSDWTYFKNGYGIKFPPDWQNTSDTGGTAVLEPGSKVGSITKVSITILSDKKATGQRFTTQTEFDQWYAVAGDVQGSIQKIDNVLVDSGNAVMLLDSSGGENEWTVIVWTRKDNVNFYITVKGNEKYSAEDATAINYLISSFKYQAPPSSGKSEK